MDTYDYQFSYNSRLIRCNIHLIEFHNSKPDEPRSDSRNRNSTIDDWVSILETKKLSCRWSVWLIWLIDRFEPTHVFFKKI